MPRTFGSARQPLVKYSPCAVVRRKSACPILLLAFFPEKPVYLDAHGVDGMHIAQDLLQLLYCLHGPRPDLHFELASLRQLLLREDALQQVLAVHQDAACLQDLRYSVVCKEEEEVHLSA